MEILSILMVAVTVEALTERVEAVETDVDHIVNALAEVILI